MPKITIQTTDLKFGALGQGILNVQIHVPDLAQPLKLTDEDLFSLTFDIGAGKSFAIGSQNNLRLGVEADTRSKLAPLWKSSSEVRKKALKDFDWENYFDQHDDRMLLLFQLGAQVDGQVAGKFSHTTLSAGLDLKAGADASYSMIRSAPIDTPAEALVRDFFGAVCLPADVSSPLTNDQAIVFEYGGYLKFNETLGVGYELSGSPSFRLAELQLSEKYNFSLLAKLNLGAAIAGRFKIVVRGGSEPGWVKVVVLKNRSGEFSLAAIGDATARIDTVGWPKSAHELLSSMLGLKAKNWLNLFEQIRKLTDFQELEKYLDKLARKFIEEYTGKAFDLLKNKTELDEFLGEVNRVTQAYHNLGNHAVTLFDRYFDPLRKEIDGELLKALKKIKDATTWDELKVQINISFNDVLWDVTNQLTEGDLLRWILGEVEINGSVVDTLELLKKRADQVLDLIQNTAHGEIRRLIALAKSNFPLDHFLEELNEVTDLAALRKKANAKLTAFVERMIGQALDTLEESEAGDAIKRFHEALVAISEFRDTIYQKITETLKQSFEFNLQAAYNRDSENKALFNFELDLESEGGKRLMRQVGLGDFSGVLTEFNKDFIKLNEGLLSHNVIRESKFTINIIGWHRKWHYEGFDRLIVEAEQRINTDDNGHLTAITTLDLEKESERKRNGERIYTNLLLRFIGESHDKLELDSSSKMYLIHAITRMSARYQLVLDDDQTRPEELNKYLAFAKEFGLAASEQEAFDKFKVLLPTDTEGNFGNISLTYDVRFTEQSLKALFNPAFYENGKFKKEVEDKLRRTMRLIILINFHEKGPNLSDIAWAYGTPGIYILKKQQGPAFVPELSSKELSPISPSPVSHLHAPIKVILRREQLRILNDLYEIEDKMIKGMEQLSELVNRNGKFKPNEFENALSEFGSALKSFDDFDQGDNTVFAIFDRLIFMAGVKERNSSLTLISNLDGHVIKQSLIA
jgi:hypothetical protein